VFAPFDWRPLEAIPGPGQAADWNAPVDDAHARKLGDQRRGGTIFPRAREDGELVTAWKAGQRPRKLVRKLADAGPFAQRGTVVEQNPHRVASYHK
jgi:hypothetical protein